MEQEQETEQEVPRNDVGQDSLPPFMAPIPEQDMEINPSNPSSSIDAIEQLPPTKAELILVAKEMGVVMRLVEAGEAICFAQ